MGLSGLFGRDDEISSDIGTPGPEEGSSGGGLPSLSAGQQVLAVFVMVLLCGLIGALASVVLFRPDPPPLAPIEEPVPNYAQPTAREAYVPAVEAARGRDAGARLMTVTGLWYPSIDTVQLGAGRTGWTYFFYLPSNREMAEVVVGENGAVRAVDTTTWMTIPALLDDARWQVDSGIALGTFQQECGDTLSGTSNYYVEARFSTAVDNVTLVWDLSAVDLDTGEVGCAIRVDGVTGLVR